ncbi:prepilin-type N-terminal cleavage/methylation domain-containing protein [Rubripirellula sp.]|jgi:general secretion pathway protein I|nr:prepilin-type N-terminal cleavage/methylation domain-containing protein [Rubripirellula sp.]MDB4654502.1 prepilin-type N-terminal cleavage/methylation domain-containing protein [Rubripirellula sp.]MDC0288570.1 prepilin-type N-terminal cleavage/methylation domain-containing protein [Rubripirellula sp.]
MTHAAFVLPTPQRASHRVRRHRGFSLLEILLALAILGGSMAILSRIVDTGISAAREARDLANARMICQAKLSEVLLNSTSGFTPQAQPSTPVESFDSQSTTPFEFSVEVQPGQLGGILLIRVVVEAQNPDGGEPLARYSLVRWMIDPALGLEELEAEEKAAREEAAGVEGSA